MEFRRLGLSDLMVSEVGLGCNNFGGRMDVEATRAVVHKSLDLGINLFDTADIYGGAGKSEELLGEVLGERRKDVIVATKFGIAMDNSGELQGASARYIKIAIEASLTRLKTDYVDLYQVHFPDDSTPMLETLEALNQLINEGKVRYIGLSNHAAWKVTDAHWISQTRGFKEFVSCQDEYSLLIRDVEKELLPMAERFEIGILPYFPLASGLLTGKYKQSQDAPEGTRFATNPHLGNRYMTPENWKRIDDLTKFSEDKGHTLLELSFAWLLRKKVVSSVIAGATKVEQVVANAAAGNWKLSEEEITRVDEIIK